MVNVPWQDKLRPGHDRILQRRTLHGLLPEIVRKRRSKTAGTWALVEGLRRNPFWFDFLTERPRIAGFGIARGPVWKRAVEQARVGHTQGDRHFMAAVSLRACFRQLEAVRAVPSSFEELKARAA